MERIGESLVPFLDLIDINFGIKTGNNSFFIVPNNRVPLINHEGKFVINFQDRKPIILSNEVLRPILTSTRGINRYTLTAREQSKYVVFIDGEREDLDPNLRVYVEWGEVLGSTAPQVVGLTSRIGIPYTNNHLRTLVCSDLWTNVVG